MEVTIAGSGTVFPDPNRRQSCVVVGAGEETIVFDLGSGALRGMLHAGIDPTDVDRVFLTHFHPDHTADLVPLVFTNGYGSVPPREKPLYLTGPTPFLGFWGSLRGAWGEWTRPRDYRLEVSELPLDCPSPLEYGDFGLTWARAEHNPESIAYRVESGGKSFVYTGDTSYCESVVKLARGADTLLIECSLPDDDAIPVHMTPSSVARTAREAEVGRVVLTHLFPKVLATDPVAAVRAGFDGEVLLAEDGLTLTV